MWSLMEWTEITQEEIQPIEKCLELHNISDYEKELKQMPNCNLF